ncbi:MAG: hypothetical protein PHH09_01415 [Methanoregulaceae archaeon]|jgi:hypothetical protein|nr:hypothetical protein [Methanoregulaceae archaeon]MDD5047569.1 hypothetical protein [Methanoregulaceae archaeon]
MFVFGEGVAITEHTSTGNLAGTTLIDTRITSGPLFALPRTRRDVFKVADVLPFWFQWFPVFTEDHKQGTIPLYDPSVLEYADPHDFAGTTPVPALLKRPDTETFTVCYIIRIANVAIPRLLHLPE